MNNLNKKQINELIKLSSDPKTWEEKKTLGVHIYVYDKDGVEHSFFLKNEDIPNYITRWTDEKYSNIYFEK